jgi:hypothetical protein
MHLKGFCRQHSLVVVLHLLVSLALLACAPPKLSHFDGRPFVPSAPITEIDNGWVAVDSCALGIHVLVELEVQARPRGIALSMLEDVVLRLGSGYIRRPQHLRVKGPFSAPKQFHHEGLEYQGGREVYGTGVPLEESFVEVYVVRAEFVLDRLPQVGDLLIVVHRHKSKRLRWP